MPPATSEDLFRFLDTHGIAHHTVHHAPVFTVDEARAVRGDLAGGHSKSLFLRNKKGRMWLIVTKEDRAIDLKDLGARLGAGRFSFGSPDRLMRVLGVIPGAVTPFAVLNDTDSAVQVVLDRGLMDMDPLNFHPLDNAMTTAVSSRDLLTFLEATGHEPQMIDF